MKICKNCEDKETCESYNKVYENEECIKEVAHRAFLEIKELIEKNMYEVNNNDRA